MHNYDQGLLTGTPAAITGTSATSVIAAQGDGLRIYVTDLLVTNSHASNGTLVTFKDGTTTLFQGYAAAGGGGFSVQFETPLQCSPNTAFNAVCGTNSSNTYISAVGYLGL